MILSRLVSRRFRGTSHFGAMFCILIIFLYFLSALKNSRTGQLSVQEIYKFLCEHFPFFNTAPQGWKNSVRHALSMNKCFQKIPDPRPKSSSSSENGSSTMLSSGGGAPNQTSAVKGFLWLLNPSKITRMEEELAKWTKKDTEGIKKVLIILHLFFLPSSYVIYEHIQMSYLLLFFIGYAISL